MREYGESQEVLKARHDIDRCHSLVFVKAKYVPQLVFEDRRDLRARYDVELDVFRIISLCFNMK